MQESNLPRRQYTDEFKIEAIELAESIGGHEAARRQGVPVATVGHWKRRRAAAELAGRCSAGSRAQSFSRACTPPGERTGGREQPPAQGAGRRKAGRGSASKSDGVPCQRITMKYVWSDRHHDQYIVSRLCRVRSLSQTELRHAYGLGHAQLGEPIEDRDPNL